MGEKQFGKLPAFSGEKEALSRLDRSGGLREGASEERGRMQLGHIENILIFFFEGPLGFLLGEAAELNFVRRK